MGFDLISFHEFLQNALLMKGYAGMHRYQNTHHLTTWSHSFWLQNSCLSKLLLPRGYGRQAPVFLDEGVPEFIGHSGLQLLIICLR
jgi:hypothetical protein